MCISLSRATLSGACQDCGTAERLYVAHFTARVSHLRSQLPSLWSRTYYIGRIGHVSEATVRRYIENQKDEALSVGSDLQVSDKRRTSGKRLGKMAGAINYVWNFCHEVWLLAFRRDKTFLSAYDLHKLTAGTSKDLRLSADTIQQVCTEYVTRRKQCKKIKLQMAQQETVAGLDTVQSCVHQTPRRHGYVLRPSLPAVAVSPY